MNCYEHRGRPAVGICVLCGRALCSDCADETTGGLSCRASRKAGPPTCSQPDSEVISHLQRRLARIVVVTFGVLVMVLGILLLLERTVWTDLFLCPAGMLCTLIGKEEAPGDADSATDWP